MYIVICAENVFHGPVFWTQLQIKVCDFDTPDGTNIWRTESKNVKQGKERFGGSLKKETVPHG